MAKTKVHGEYLRDSVVRFTAKAGENITKGQPVYISGISGELPVVSLADADNTAKMPAFGLAEATVTTNAEVEVTSFGTLAGLDTSTPGYSLGDILYVDTTAGALTNNPSGLEATKLQNIGIVQRVHASNGSIKVGGAGRTNAVPNLDDGDIFIGDSNNKAISSSLATEIESYLDGGTSSPVLASLTVDTDTLYVDSANNRVGIGTASPAQALVVNRNSGNTYLDIRRATQSQGQVALQLAGGTGGTNWIMYQDTSSNDLRFYGNSDNRVTIDTSGNVGIGTTDPKQKLTVAGRLNSDGNNDYYGAWLTGDTSTGGYNHVAVGAWYSSAAYLERKQGEGYTHLYEYNPAHHIVIQAGSGDNGRASSSAGNVGIGTTSPAVKTHIYNSTTSNEFLRIEQGTSAYGAQIRFINPHNSLAYIGLAGDSTGDLLHYNGADTNSLFYTGGTERMRIHNKSTLFSNRVGLNYPCELMFNGEYNVSNQDVAVEAGRVARIEYLKDDFLRFQGTASVAAGAGVTYTDRVKIDIANGGILFGSDTAAANALDDYEEGTWTPNVHINGHTQSVSSTSGKYVKIGSMVHAYFSINYSAAGYASSWSLINNLPFAIPSGGYDGTAGNYGTSSISANAWGSPTWVATGSSAVYMYPSYSTVNTTNYSGFCVYFIS